MLGRESALAFIIILYYIMEKNKKWEIKDRTYILSQGLKPLTLRLQSKSSPRRPLLWFDEEAGYQKELRYATNQKSPFVEDQDKNALLGHIVFNKGVLRVPKQNQVLQKLLSLYHPHKDKRYFEYSPVEEAKDDLEFLDVQVDAMALARDMEVDQAEAIMRVEIGSEVNKMSSKELKRDLILFASNNPELFLELANDDNVELRNFGIVATEANIIKLSQDQRTFSWGSNGKKLMTVPFEENPYSALAVWFKTDEGVEVYKSIQKKLK
tara:strand:- start:1958 stop:2758 length:801 start_codon:yes stop_codon:yes gene_type:complete